MVERKQKKKHWYIGKELISFDLDLWLYSRAVKGGGLAYLDKVGIVVAILFIIKGCKSTGATFQLIVKVRDDLRQRQAVLEKNTALIQVSMLQWNASAGLTTTCAP